MEFSTHLIELRKRLIYALVIFILGLIILLPFANSLYLILATPLVKLLGTNTHLIATDITSPFFTPLKVTILTAFYLSLPNTLYQIWRFIAPGLYQKEKWFFLSLSIISFVLFSVGILFCYFLVLPGVFHFITQFKSPNIEMLTDINQYLDFILHLFLIFGLAFQMPLVVFILVYNNLLSKEKAKQLRPYVLVASFIVAAIVTPPDVLSQTFLAIPLYLLYELGVLIARLFKSKPSN